MARKAPRKLKVTAAQQLTGLRIILDATRSELPKDEIFKGIVESLPLPFHYLKIQDGESSFESVRNVDPAAIVAEGLLDFTLPNGSLTVGHSEPVSIDKGLSRWLEDLAMLLGMIPGSRIEENKLPDGNRAEIEELQRRLEMIVSESAREIEAARESARNEIEKVKAESSEKIQEVQRQSDAKAQEDALWDEQTLLPNSKLFPLMMSPMLAHARRSTDLAAIMYLEFGRLDEMVQSHGFQKGDKIVRLVLERMMKNLREGDIAVRAGENRILWCLGGLHTLEDTATVAEKMLLSLSRPLDVDGKTVGLTGSIGISLFPYDAPDPETLMSHAETALEVSRKTQGNAIRFYSKEMNEKVRNYLLSRKELKDATAKQEFALHYQPVVRFVSNEVDSVEALIRWRKPQGLTIYPGNFLGLSEQIGIASQLDEWMIRSACTQRNHWEQEGLGNLRTSVNISNHFWENGVEKLSRILKETSTSPVLVDLEIAERHILKDPEKASERLAQYSELGVNLTIDDFGASGGLLDISRYKIDTIKLSASYTRGITADSPQSAVVASAISMAHHLKVRIIAKSVETQAERAVLEGLGCDGYQGNLFSPALPKSLLTEFLRKQQMKPAPPPITLVEKTQPMAPEVNEIPFVQPEPKVEKKTGPAYMISCFQCQMKFDANEAQWCSCITADPSVICPGCQKCFCRATLDYRHSVWGAAPESFWDRKRKEEESYSLSPNPILPDMKRPIILIVDDEEAVLKVASRLIRKLGYSVVVGHNGEEGIYLAKHYKPDLIISDALMPKLDGREMCNMLKKDPETANIKTIILTAFTGAAKYKITVLRDFHFDEHLQKPVEFDKLRNALQRLL